MSNIREVKEALKILIKFGKSKSQITVLHCTSDFPAAIGDINLNAMQTLQKSLNLPVGYSDHSLGKDVAIGAVALGAKIIERHITLDRANWGTDQAASLSETGIEQLTTLLRKIPLTLGDGEKKFLLGEKKVSSKM